MHRRTPCCLLACSLLILGSLRLLADGPGIGNLTYGTNELFSTIATFTAANSAPRGHGFVAMHRGYLVVIFSNDGGGGAGSGGFTFYNVSNPRSPVATFTTYNNPAYSSTNSPNYAGDIREAHAFSFYSNYVCMPSNKGLGTGLQFWDWSTIDPPAPTPAKVSSLNLPCSSIADPACRIPFPTARPAGSA
jgi:hypothetical protein